MSAAPDLAGMLQRAMFLVAYLWYGREVLSLDRVEAAREAAP